MHAETGGHPIRFHIALTTFTEHRIFLYCETCKEYICMPLLNPEFHDVLSEVVLHRTKFPTK